MWFERKGDARLERCDSEGCGGAPIWRLGAGGTGSNYCSGCKERIERGLAPIKLVCLNCMRSMEYAREIDPEISPDVVRIAQPHCDECWNGDREGEIWYDSLGREVPQHS